MSIELLNATVTERTDLNEDLSIVRVQPDGGSVPEFQPGQFVTLGLPREDGLSAPQPERSGRAPSTRARLIRRAYSIASSPNTREYVEFVVVLVQNGRLTPRLWTISRGGRVWMDDRIKGKFTLDGVPADQNLVMISTGTGIAPFMSMLRTYRGQSRWRRLVLIHGVRRAVDLAYRDELEWAGLEDPSVLYVPLASREPEDSGWRGLRGRVQLALGDTAYRRLTGTRLDPHQTHVFLCGNPEMIKSVQTQLEQRGFITQTRNRPGNIHFERYW